MLTITDLDISVKAVCPIHGIAPKADGTYRIDFADAATADQRAAAEAVVASFDWTADPPWSMSAEAFSDLFTDAELVAIQTSTDANVIRLRTTLQTRQDPVVQDSAKLQGGIAYLVAIGILTQSRADRILSGKGPVQ